MSTDNCGKSGKSDVPPSRNFIKPHMKEAAYDREDQGTYRE